MSACGAVRAYVGVPSLVRAKPRAGTRRRLAAALAWPWRATSPAVLGLAAPSQNSLRSLRSLRSNSCDESVYEARCTRGPQALRSSAPQMRAAGHPPTALRDTPDLFVREGREAGIEPASRRAPQGASNAESQARCLRFGFLHREVSVDCKDAGGRRAQRICGAEEHRACGRARSALRKQTRRSCPSAESEANAASSATGRKPEHRRGVGPRSGPTAAAKRSPPPARVFARAILRNDAFRASRVARSAMGH